MSKKKDIHSFSDDEIIKLCKGKQSKEAKEIMFERYSGYIVAIANVFLSTRYTPKTITLEDLISEGYFVFLGCLDKYNYQNTFRPYLRISLLRYFDKYNQKEISEIAKRYVSFDDVVYNDNDNICFSEVLGKEDFEDEIEEKKSIIAKKRSNSSLKPIEKEILEMKLQGQKIKYIAKKLGMNEASVKYRLRVIKNKISK